VIAEALALAAEILGDDAPRVLARLRGLAPAAERSGPVTRAEVLAVARAPVPASLRHVHPTWIEHALAALPERARTVLASGVDDAVDVWLARWATAALPPTGDRDALEWLTSIGTDQYAFALGEQARALPALAAAVDRIAKPPRAGELGPKRAAIERCSDISLDDDLAFVRVACRALAPHLAADQLVLVQLIRSLPRVHGLVVARELALHARASIDRCPSWAALTAQ
jgi:hypothetical protein